MKRRVLVADDEVLLLAAIRMVLEDEGYDTTGVGDGRSCLQLLERDLPDVLLLDSMMPVCSGLEVLSVLRRDERTRDLPVILMSAVRPEALRSLPVQGFLRKPFEIDHLLAAMNRVLPEGEK